MGCRRRAGEADDLLSEILRAHIERRLAVLEGQHAGRRELPGRLAMLLTPLLHTRQMVTGQACSRSGGGCSHDHKYYDSSVLSELQQ